MLYLIEAHDLPGALERRIELRQKHIEYWRSTNCVKIAGAMMTDDSADASPRGSFLIIEASEIAEARSLLERDPFMRDGVFAPDVRFTRFRPGLGAWSEQ